MPISSTSDHQKGETGVSDEIPNIIYEKMDAADKNLDKMKPSLQRSSNLVSAQIDRLREKERGINPKQVTTDEVRKICSANRILKSRVVNVVDNLDQSRVLEDENKSDTSIVVTRIREKQGKKFEITDSEAPEGINPINYGNKIENNCCNPKITFRQTNIRRKGHEISSSDGLRETAKGINTVVSRPLKIDTHTDKELVFSEASGISESIDRSLALSFESTHELVCHVGSPETIRSIAQSPTSKVSFKVPVSPDVSRNDEIESSLSRNVQNDTEASLKVFSRLESSQNRVNSSLSDRVITEKDKSIRTDENSHGLERRKLPNLEQISANFLEYIQNEATDNNLITSDIVKSANYDNDWKVNYLRATTKDVPVSNKLNSAIDIGLQSKSTPADLPNESELSQNHKLSFKSKTKSTPANKENVSDKALYINRKMESQSTNNKPSEGQLTEQNKFSLPPHEKDEFEKVMKETSNEISRYQVPIDKSENPSISTQNEPVAIPKPYGTSVEKREASELSNQDRNEAIRKRYYGSCDKNKTSLLTPKDESSSIKDLYREKSREIQAPTLLIQDESMVKQGQYHIPYNKSQTSSLKTKDENAAIGKHGLNNKSDNQPLPTQDDLVAIPEQYFLPADQSKASILSCAIDETDVIRKRVSAPISSSKVKFASPLTTEQPVTMYCKSEERKGAINENIQTSSPENDRQKSVAQKKTVLKHENHRNQSEDNRAKMSKFLKSNPVAEQDKYLLLFENSDALKQPFEKMNEKKKSKTMKEDCHCQGSTREVKPMPLEKYKPFVKEEQYLRRSPDNHETVAGQYRRSQETDKGHLSQEQTDAYENLGECKTPIDVIKVETLHLQQEKSVSLAKDEIENNTMPSEHNNFETKEDRFCTQYEKEEAETTSVLENKNKTEPAIKIDTYEKNKSNKYKSDIKTMTTEQNSYVKVEDMYHQPDVNDFAKKSLSKQDEYVPSVEDTHDFKRKYHTLMSGHNRLATIERKHHTKDFKSDGPAKFGGYVSMKDRYCEKNEKSEFESLSSDQTTESDKGMNQFNRAFHRTQGKQSINSQNEQAFNKSESQTPPQLPDFDSQEETCKGLKPVSFPAAYHSSCPRKQYSHSIGVKKQHISESKEGEQELMSSNDNIDVHSECDKRNVSKMEGCSNLKIITKSFQNQMEELITKKLKHTYQVPKDNFAGSKEARLTPFAENSHGTLGQKAINAFNKTQSEVFRERNIKTFFTSQSNETHIITVRSPTKEQNDRTTNYRDSYHKQMSVEHIIRTDKAYAEMPATSETNHTDKLKSHINEENLRQLKRNRYQINKQDKIPGNKTHCTDHISHDNNKLAHLNVSENSSKRQNNKDYTGNIAEKGSINLQLIKDKTGGSGISHRMEQPLKCKMGISDDDHQKHSDEVYILCVPSYEKGNETYITKIKHDEFENEEKLVNRTNKVDIESLDDEFHIFVRKALPRNVYRLQEDIERVLSVKLSKQDMSPNAGNYESEDIERIANEANNMLLARIETLLSLCNAFDGDEYRQPLKQLLGRLQNAFFGPNGRTRDHIHIYEVDMVVKGLTNLIENEGILVESLSSENIAETIYDDNATGRGSHEINSAAADSTSNAHEIDYDDNSRRQFLNTERKTLFKRQQAVLKRNLHFVVIGLGIITGTTMVLFGPSAAKMVYNFVLLCIIFVLCNVKFIQPNHL